LKYLIILCWFKNIKMRFFIYQMKARYQNCSQLAMVAAAAMMVLACTLKIVVANEGIVDDLAGDYCAKVGCCTERRDEGCSAPILGTMCYCDDFCYFNRTGSNDCCPDFMSFCKGIESPPPEPLLNLKREWFSSYKRMSVYYFFLLRPT